MNHRTYRGKIEDGYKWVYGSYFKCMPGHFILTDIETVIEDSHNIGSRVYPDMNDCYKVIPESVGQCTGLKDKNGKLIFEGDLLKCHPIHEFPLVWECRFYEKWAQFAFFRDAFPNDGGVGYRYDFVIIGNIHDNPELIGQKNDTPHRRNAW